MSYAHTSSRWACYNPVLFFSFVFPSFVFVRFVILWRWCKRNFIPVCIFDSWCTPVEPGCEVGIWNFTFSAVRVNANSVFDKQFVHLSIRSNAVGFQSNHRQLFTDGYIERPERERLEKRRVKNIQLGNLKLLYILLKRYSLCCERIAVNVVRGVHGRPFGSPILSSPVNPSDGWAAISSENQTDKQDEDGSHSTPAQPTTNTSSQ